MNKGQILKVNFFIWFVCMIIGAALKIMHYSYGGFLLNVSIACYFIFAALAIYEVLQSNRIEKNEKFMWMIGLLFLGTLTGILYLVTGRKRIVNNFTNENSTSSSYEN